MYSLKYLLFTVIFLGIANWISVYYFLINLFKPRQKLVSVKDKEMLAKLKRKTGLDSSIRLMEINKMIGFMISSPPFPPVMVFSNKLFNAFNNNEREWVLLHEAAHYFMWHSLKFALSQLIILIIGLLLIKKFIGNDWILSVSFIGLLLGIIYVQIAKIFEYQADTFAAENMDNPRGMITGNIKMRKANTGILANPIMKKLFIIAVPYEKRIKLAERQLKGLKMHDG